METKIYTKDLCVFFLTTKHEYQRGMVELALDNYLKNCESNYCYDLYIVFDVMPKFRKKMRKIFYDIQEKYENVNKINIVSNDIPKHENFYNMALAGSVDIIKYPLGASHGVNLHFYQTLDYLLNLKDDTDNKKYNNVMLLETDTKPLRCDWFDVALDCCQTKLSYNIMGSTYKGIDREKTLNMYYGPHLNGVAIYRNNDLTIHILNESKLFLINCLKEEFYRQFMNYDVAIYLYLRKLNKVDECLYDTDFITNASDARNFKTTMKSILENYPETRIIHKKGLY